MAVRTVSVELKMKISDFELAAAKAAATTKALAGEFDDLGKTSSKFSTAKPTKEMQNFSRVIDAAARDGMSGLQGIQRAIDDTKIHITKLRSEFARTGSSSVFGDLKSAQKDLRTLENVFKEIAPAAEKAGLNIGQRMAQGLTDSLAKDVSGIGEILSNPVTLAGVVVAVAAWSPIIASTVSAGVTAGAGLGLVGAAALIQRNNPQIVGAFKDLSGEVKTVLQDATQPLVGPMADALKSIESFVATEGPAIAKVFAPLGPAIHMMAVDFEGLIHDILPPLANLSAEFSSAFQSQVVQAALFNLSHEFAALFQTVADHPQEIREGFILIAGAIQLAVGAVNDFIKFAHVMNEELQIGADLVTGHWGKAWDVLKSGSKESVQPITQLGDVINGVAVGTQRATIDFQQLGAAAGGLGDEIVNVLLGAFDQYIDKSLGVSNATIAFKNDLANLTASLKANGTSFDLNTQKGRNNQQMLNQGILDAKNVYDANITNGKGVDAASLAYQMQLDQLKKNLIAGGLTSAQVAKLTRQYELLPAQKATLIKAEGTGAAQAAVDGVLGALGKLPKDRNVNINVHAFGVAAAEAAVNGILGALGRSGSRGNRWGGIYEHNRWGGLYQPAADGLLSQARTYTPVNPGRFMIAEPQTGGEAFVPKRGDYGRSMSILSAAAGWYGARVVPGGGGGGSPVSITITASDPQSKAFLAAARIAVQNNGGDPVKVFTPR